MADSKRDPTVTSRSASSGWADGTHPVAAPSDQDWGPHRFTYSDLPASEKPDKSTVAQIVESDPLLDKAEKALREDAKR